MKLFSALRSISPSGIGIFLASLFIPALWGTWRQNSTPTMFARGDTIIILLQKYGIFGYTTDIEQLRDPQANSKQDSFSALFNLDYVAALRHINT